MEEESTNHNKSYVSTAIQSSNLNWFNIDFLTIHLNDHGSNSCGYCKKSPKSKLSYQWGFTSPKMSCKDYQDLMERGWRRCGDYYYKPDLQKSCCQLNTIRLEAENFVKFDQIH